LRGRLSRKFGQETRTPVLNDFNELACGLATIPLRNMSCTSIEELWKRCATCDRPKRCR